MTWLEDIIRSRGKSNAEIYMATLGLGAEKGEKHATKEKSSRILQGQSKEDQGRARASKGPLSSDQGGLEVCSSTAERPKES